MDRAGYQPSLAAVDPAADPEILSAFTLGVDITSTVLSAIVAAMLAVLVVWSWRTHYRRAADR
jgi:hypothetical protein